MENLAQGANLRDKNVFVCLVGPKERFSSLFSEDYLCATVVSLGKGFPNGVARFWFNHGGNFVVKRAQAGVVFRWVTS